jgi:hypothetical protein
MPMHEYYESNRISRHPAHPHQDDGLSVRIAKSSAITGFIAAAMIVAGVPVNTVLPTSAPIWMGFAMLLSRK